MLAYTVFPTESIPEPAKHQDKIGMNSPSHQSPFEGHGNNNQLFGQQSSTPSSHNDLGSSSSMDKIALPLWSPPLTSHKVVNNSHNQSLKTPKAPSQCSPSPKDGTTTTSTSTRNPNNNSITHQPSNQQQPQRANFNSTRRSIFGNLQRQSTNPDKSEAADDGSISQHSNSSHTESIARIRRLTRPPPDAKYVQDKPYFVGWDESTLQQEQEQMQQQLEQQEPQSPDTITETHMIHPQQAPLPELPTPLQRFYAHDPDALSAATQMTKPLDGPYPLLATVRPILRDSSYGKSLDRMAVGASGSSSSLSSSSSSLASDHYANHKNKNNKIAAAANNSNNNNGLKLHFNLTDSKRTIKRTVRPPPSFSAAPGCISCSLLTGSNGSRRSNNSSGSTSSNGNRHRVRFDPRVTVTEFADSVPRYWFSEMELERMRWDTVNAVRKFLLQNPSLIPVYNQPKYDPITNSYRRKAMFSIPVLQAATAGGDPLPDQGDALAKEERKAYAKYLLVAMHSQVKHIVIAVRNRLVQDLLARSLRTLFPQAHVETVSCGEDAFELFKQGSLQQDKSIDILVAEGRLHMQTPSHNSQQQHHPVDESVAEKEPTQEPSTLDQNQTAPAFLSGAQLFQKVRDLQLVSRSKATLMIGVTTTTTKNNSAPTASSCDEGQEMKEHGASLVWELPPPPMDEKRRLEIVSLLLQKRASSATPPVEQNPQIQ